MKIKTRVIGWLSIIIIAIVIGGIFLSVFVSEQFKKVTLERAIKVNSNFILTHSQASLSADDFTPDKFEEKEKTFSNFFVGVDTAEILRIKVWSTDGTIIYSDDKSIIGNNYVDNTSFQKALEGETPAVIKEPVKPENISEKGYGQLMEIYVPIESESGQVMGIIETYTSLDLVNNSIADTNKIIFMIIFTSSIFVAAIVIFVFISIQKNMINPILQVRNASKKIAGGDFNIQIKTKGDEEIKNLAKDIEDMSQELADQREILVKTERFSAIGELAARLSHDLRNPLHVIRNTLLIIKNESLQKINETTKNDFERIDRSISRMTHQVESVLDFVKVSPITLTKCSILKILNSATDRIKKPDSVTINLPKNDLEITCDATKLEVVFENLLMNAIQAIQNTKGHIDIRIAEHEKFTSVEFEDSGPGIPPNTLPKIFDPLFTTKQEGTGLGLASCKRLIEQHDGTIVVKTNPTVFVINIPREIKITSSEEKKLNKIILSEQIHD